MKQHITPLAYTFISASRCHEMDKQSFIELTL
jgi:hypothetical protein